MNRHYFFKVGYGNDLLTNKVSALKENTLHDFPIFFDNWTVEDYRGNPLYINDKKNHKQINAFLNLTPETDYLWVYMPSKIYVFQVLRKPITSKSKEFLQYTKGRITPKSVLVKLYGKFDKKELPECFSTLNANQSYNRKTINQLTGIEDSIANHLVEKKEGKLGIRWETACFYLSPVQFETLIFLIFHHNDCFVTTYRGGTRSEIDLIVRPYSDFDSFVTNTTYSIQIKRQEFRPNSQISSSHDNFVLVHLGYTDKNKGVFGLNWIYNKILRNRLIENWLRESLNFFTIVN